MTDPLILVPNLKRRLSGVTATIVRLVPIQAREVAIRATGPGLPAHVPHINLLKVALLPRKTRRVWHARRNTEMLLGLALKKALRKDMRLLFTSASQREHTGYTKWLIDQMDRVIATSGRGATYLKDAVEVVPHGIDLTAFSPTDDKAALRGKLGLPAGRLVGCFGRVRHQKGTDLFVDTMLDAMARHDDLVGVVLGRATAKHKTFEAELQEKVAKAGLSDRLIFAGEVPVDQIADWYRALDLFIAPQRWEGFGLTPIEAMACGIPVIATRVGAFEDLIVDGETGVLIPRDDLPAMQAALEQVLSDPAFLRSASKAARAHTEENLSIETEARRLNTIYQDMLKGD